MKKPANIHLAPGDGDSIPVTKEIMEQLTTELDDIAHDWRSTFNRNMNSAESIRHCIWPNQTTDGRKWANGEIGSKEDVFPFPGASDLRIRTAGELVTLKKAICIASLRRAVEKIEPMEGNDAETAGYQRTLLRWIVRNQLGSSFWNQAALAADWHLNDSPGVAIIGTYVHEEAAVELRDMTSDQLALMIMQRNPEVDAAAMLADPAYEALLVKYMEDLFPHLLGATLRRMVRDIITTGACKYPWPVAKPNVPEVCVHRIYDDIFVPYDTPQDIQKARKIFVREWIDEVELRARVLTMDYSEEFVDAMLANQSKRGNVGSAGETFLAYGAGGEYFNTVPDDTYKKQFEIITAYWRASNKDGVPGIYTVDFSYSINMAATPAGLLDYPHGKYPFVALCRNHLTRRLLDATGIPEEVGTDQEYAKRFADLISDFTSLKAFKQFEVPASRGIVVKLRPFAQHNVTRHGDVAPLDLAGETPQTLPLIIRDHSNRVDRFYGVPSKEVSEVITQILDQNLVDNWLTAWSDVLLQVMQLAQYYLDDETIALATGTANSGAPKTKDAIAGAFDFTMGLHVGELNLDFYLKVMDAFSKLIVPMDRDASIVYSKAVQYFSRAIDPYLAAATLRPVEAATEAEIEDEKAKVSQIATGIEPVIRDKGENNALRLQTITEMLQKNPYLAAAIQARPDSRAMLEARIQGHQFQITQRENAQIGRIGTSPVMDKGVPVEAAPAAPAP